MGGKIQFDGVDWRIKDLSLSRAFGDVECTPYVTHLPQIYRYKVSSSDKYLVLACDGLWDVLSNQDVVDYVNELRHDEDFKGDYAKNLAEYALAKGSQDNISVVVYFFFIMLYTTIHFLSYNQYTDNSNKQLYKTHSTFHIYLKNFV